jgi:magnesium-transporting ATPase (P-type)
MEWIIKLLVIGILMYLGFIGFYYAFRNYDSQDNFEEVLLDFWMLSSSIAGLLGELALRICKRLLPERGYLIIYRIIACVFGITMIAISILLGFTSF